MHALEKLFGLELVIGLPKLKSEKDLISDTCLRGKKTHSSFNVNDTSTKRSMIFYLDNDH